MRGAWLARIVRPIFISTNLAAGAITLTASAGAGTLRLGKADRTAFSCVAIDVGSKAGI